MRYWPMLLVCPLMTGCFGYFYPSITQTPAIAVKEPDVKAFRVEVDTTFFGFISIPRQTCAIDEITCIGEIPSQCDAHFTYFALAVPIIPIVAWNSNDAAVCLYRRGYETTTLEARPWLISFWKNQIREIVWKKAESLESREKAIIDVRPFRVLGRVYRYDPAVSEFITGEYLELANSDLAAGPEHKEAREHLIELAKTIREGRD